VARYVRSITGIWDNHCVGNTRNCARTTTEKKKKEKEKKKRKEKRGCTIQPEFIFCLPCQQNTLHRNKQDSKRMRCDFGVIGARSARHLLPVCVCSAIPAFSYRPSLHDSTFPYVDVWGELWVWRGVAGFGLVI